jgi:D-alanine--poly(phosphoribitol) ligase subunit 2
MGSTPLSNLNNIRRQVELLAAGCGHANVRIDDDAMLPDTGLLDSGAIIELICWVETEFSFEMPEEDITRQNLGSINRIAA